MSGQASPATPINTNGASPGRSSAPVRAGIWPAAHPMTRQSRTAIAASPITVRVRRPRQPSMNATIATVSLLFKPFRDLDHYPGLLRSDPIQRDRSDKLENWAGNWAGKRALALIL